MISFTVYPQPQTNSVNDLTLNPRSLQKWRHSLSGFKKNIFKKLKKYIYIFFLFWICNWCFKEPPARLLDGAYRRLPRVKCQNRLTYAYTHTVTFLIHRLEVAN